MKKKLKRWQIWLENEKVLNKDFKSHKRKKLIRKIDSVPQYDASSQLSSSLSF